jgi:hypothetical protein
MVIDKDVAEDVIVSEAAKALSLKHVQDRKSRLKTVSVGP